MALISVPFAGTWASKPKVLGNPPSDRVAKKVRVSKKSKKTVTAYSQSFGKVVLFKKKK